MVITRDYIEEKLTEYGNWSEAIAHIVAEHPHLETQTPMQAQGIQPGNNMLDLILDDIDSYEHTEASLD